MRRGGGVWSAVFTLSRNASLHHVSNPKNEFSTDLSSFVRQQLSGQLPDESGLWRSIEKSSGGRGRDRRTQNAGILKKKIILKKSFEAFAADQLAASEKISFISSGSVRRKRRNGAAPSDGATIAVTCARRVDGAGAGKRETLRPDAV